MTSSDARRACRWLTIFFGAGPFCGAFFVAAPRAWFAGAWVWLGLGPFPEEPMVELLARGLAGLYAVVGLGIIVAGIRPLRHVWVARVLVVGVAAMAIANASLAVRYGIVVPWAVSDAALGAVTVPVILWLQVKAGREEGSRSPQRGERLAPSGR